MIKRSKKDCPNNIISTLHKKAEQKKMPFDDKMGNDTSRRKNSQKYLS